MIFKILVDIDLKIETHRLKTFHYDSSLIKRSGIQINVAITHTNASCCRGDNCRVSGASEFTGCTAFWILEH